jgi:anhydro-N-acetylmuramic acid kinase
MMSGSSLDGLDIACVEFEQVSGQWQFSVLAAECHPYSDDWVKRLRDATRLPAREYLLLHSAYGYYMGEAVNQFIREKELQFKVQLIASHGHTTFHVPESKMTAQLGDGAAIAAVTGIHTVSDLRAMDVALGGQGAPVVPIGDQLLLPGYDYYLNLGGIANVTWYVKGQPIAFDVCPANRVLNMLSAIEGDSMQVAGATQCVFLLQAAPSQITGERIRFRTIIPSHAAVRRLGSRRAADICRAYRRTGFKCGCTSP